MQHKTDFAEGMATYMFADPGGRLLGDCW